MNKKSINKFAILVIVMILAPEIAGHLLFEKSYPASSSVNAAVLFTHNLLGNAGKSGICHLEIISDPPGANITRAAGLEGKYGDFTCV
jgi:hypothetical protein